ncbi:hypothetical protein [uncultured Maritimibacter sp.]|uniref:hypothetical protein n=1 Tax=uncultured Maritimibacter sp. TaxID=991866 RepID=UPI00259A0E99|nr:hypothetical protein [uncultured Maritimibacter sp.]
MAKQTEFMRESLDVLGKVRRIMGEELRNCRTLDLLTLFFMLMEDYELDVGGRELVGSMILAAAEAQRQGFQGGPSGDLPDLFGGGK